MPTANDIDDPATDQFEGKLRGHLIQPADSEDDSGRAIYNAMIDRYPRLLGRGATVADVIAAVNQNISPADDWSPTDDAIA